MRWTKEEDKILLENYQLPKKQLLMLLPSRTAASINIRASLLGYKKQQNEYKNSDISILLNDDILSYYWIGFIMADGCFSGPSLNRLQIKISAKDSEHLEKLARYIKTDCVYTTSKKTLKKYVTLTAQDKFNSPLIRQKFDFKQAKTYNPPQSIKTNDFNLCLALLAGLIDGDGNIGKQHNRQNYFFRIKCHRSWQNFYNILDSKLFVTPNPSKINKKGYFEYSIYRKDTITKFLQSIKKLNLPLMDRKWLKIFNEYHSVFHSL